jgi:hypothetical protein
MSIPENQSLNENTERNKEQEVSSLIKEIRKRIEELNNVEDIEKLIMILERQIFKMKEGILKVDELIFSDIILNKILFYLHLNKYTNNHYSDNQNKILEEKREDIESERSLLPLLEKILQVGIDEYSKKIKDSKEDIKNRKDQIPEKSEKKEFIQEEKKEVVEEENEYLKAINKIYNKIGLERRSHLSEDLFAVAHGIDPETNLLLFEPISGEIGMKFDSHGIAKSEQLKKLLELLTKGIDCSKPFYTAPFEVPNEIRVLMGPGMGTSGGTAYKTGLAVVTSGYNEKLIEDGIKHVFINDVYKDLVEPLSKEFPQYNFHLLSQQKQVMEDEYSKQIKDPENKDSVEEEHSSANENAEDQSSNDNSSQKEEEPEEKKKGEELGDDISAEVKQSSTNEDNWKEEKEIWEEIKREFDEINKIKNPFKKSKRKKELIKKVEEYAEGNFSLGNKKIHLDIDQVLEELNGRNPWLSLSLMLDEKLVINKEHEIKEEEAEVISQEGASEEPENKGPVEVEQSSTDENIEDQSSNDNSNLKEEKQITEEIPSVVVEHSSLEDDVPKEEAEVISQEGTSEEAENKGPVEVGHSPTDENMENQSSNNNSSPKEEQITEEIPSVVVEHSSLEDDVIKEEAEIISQEGTSEEPENKEPVEVGQSPTDGNTENQSSNNNSSQNKEEQIEELIPIVISTDDSSSDLPSEASVELEVEKSEEHKVDKEEVEQVVEVAEDGRSITIDGKKYEAEINYLYLNKLKKGIDFSKTIDVEFFELKGLKNLEGLIFPVGTSGIIFSDNLELQNIKEGLEFPFDSITKYENGKWIKTDEEEMEKIEKAKREEKIWRCLKDEFDSINNIRESIFHSSKKEKKELIKKVLELLHKEEIQIDFNDSLYLEGKSLSTAWVQLEAILDVKFNLSSNGKKVQVNHDSDNIEKEEFKIWESLKDEFDSINNIRESIFHPSKKEKEALIKKVLELQDDGYIVIDNADTKDLLNHDLNLAWEQLRLICEYKLENKHNKDFIKIQENYDYEILDDSKSVRIGEKTYTELMGYIYLPFKRGVDLSKLNVTKLSLPNIDDIEELKISDSVKSLSLGLKKGVDLSNFKVEKLSLNDIEEDIEGLKVAETVKIIELARIIKGNNQFLIDLAQGGKIEIITDRDK